MTQPRKRRFDKDTAVRLMGYAAGTYRLRFASVLVFILVSSAANVAGALFLKMLIDGYIAPLLGMRNPAFSGLLRAIGGMAAIYMAGVAATYAYNRQMAIIGQGVQKRIRNETFERMQKLPIRYFDSHSYGDTMSRFTNDIDTLRQMISQSIPVLFSSLVTMTLVLAAMLTTSFPLTALALLMVYALVRVSGRVTGKSGGYFVRQQQDIGDLNGYIEEMMDGQKVVKVFCHEDESEKEFDRKNERLFESADKANKYANVLMPIMVNLSNLNYVLVAIVGGAMAIGGVGGMTLGAIASFLQLTKSFSMPVGQMAQQINSVIMALAGAERIFRLMDEEPEQDNGYVTLVNARYDDAGILAEAEEHTGTWAWRHPHGDGTLTYTEVRGDIVFDDVDFSYDGEKTVLHEVTLHAKPGQKIAFVGATGAGKTTITNLINRFYDIADGKIRYDGININKIKKDDLRRSLGVVLQDTHLFTGTVTENIRYGKLDASDEEVFAAASLAGADSFIERLPDAYDTVISGDGAGLSQGQRQLLAIARAAVADPPVMILDEATSSIDTRTEKQVQSGMDALMEGRTVFVIAHRLSTVRNAKAILVLDKGRIIERGSHDELIRQKGRYYQLYTGAFESADEFEQETA